MAVQGKIEIAPVANGIVVIKCMVKVQQEFIVQKSPWLVGGHLSNMLPWKKHSFLQISFC